MALSNDLATLLANDLSGGSNPAAAILGSLYHSDFDTRDAAITFNGNKVASWPNRGLDGAPALQNSDANRPIWSSSSFFGAPGITSNGTSQWLNCAFNSPIGVAKRPIIFCVGARIATASGFAFRIDDNIVANAVAMEYGATDYVTQRFDSGGNQNPNAGTFALDTLRHTFEVGYTAVANDVLIIDGAQATTTGTLTGTSTNPTVACRFFAADNAGTAGCNFIMRRLIIAADEPSAAQKAALRAYLSGLQ